ncbi:MAG: hypothetical protein R2743_02060 [Ilumatobacteraceae bacterium]
MGSFRLSTCSWPGSAVGDPNLIQLSPAWIAKPNADAPTTPPTARTPTRFWSRIVSDLDTMRDQNVTSTARHTPAATPSPTLARVVMPAASGNAATSRSVRSGRRPSSRRTVPANAHVANANAHSSVSWYTLTQPDRNSSGEQATAATNTPMRRLDAAGAARRTRWKAPVSAVAYPAIIDSRASRPENRSPNTAKGSRARARNGP